MCTLSWPILYMSVHDRIFSFHLKETSNSGYWPCKCWTTGWQSRPKVKRVKYAHKKDDILDALFIHIIILCQDNSIKRGITFESPPLSGVQPFDVCLQRNFQASSECMGVSVRVCMCARACVSDVTFLSALSAHPLTWYVLSGISTWSVSLCARSAHSISWFWACTYSRSCPTQLDS